MLNAKKYVYHFCQTLLDNKNPVDMKKQENQRKQAILQPGEWCIFWGVFFYFLSNEGKKFIGY